MINRLSARFAAVASLALASILVPAAVAFAPAAPSASHLSSQVISQFEATPKPLETLLLVDPAARENAAFKALAPKLSSRNGGSVFKGKLTLAEAQILSGIPGIAVGLNYQASTNPITENNPKWMVPNLKWDAEVTVPQSDPALAAARVAANVDGSGVLVAVLDTGVDPQALGLSGKVVHRVDFTSPPDPTKCTDDGRLDPYGHGTHVASIIAGAKDSRDNTVEGVAPGAQILDLRVLDCSGSGDFASVDQALQWIHDHKAEYPVKVVNMSIGASDGQRDGLDPTSIWINRLVAEGIFVAVAAGNSGAASNTLFMPATAEFATTVAAATVNNYGKFLAQYSSHGPTSDGRAGIDVTAPGSGIRAALTTAKSSLNNYSVTMSGTSMATPYTAGLAALLVQKYPNSKPSGTVCQIDSTCTAGVVRNTMTNGIQDLIKTSDWFAPGIDPDTGAGLLSASATLNGTSMAAAHSSIGTLDGNSDNTIRIPAHTEPTTMQLYLDTSYRSDMWDRASFTVLAVDANYNQKPLEVVCTLLASTSCLFGESTFTPRLFTYYLPPSSETTIFVFKSSKTLNYRINIDSYTGQVLKSSGVTASGASLASSTNGTITLERTSTSASSNTYSIVTSGALSAPATVTLPSGAAGTQVTVPITSATSSVNSLERVVFTDSNGHLIASSVQTRTTGQGPLIYPNALGYDESDQTNPIFLADDGSLLGASSGSQLGNSSGYANPFRVAANSRMVTKYNITQTSSSQIDVVGYSQDGTRAIFRQFPAGAGVVPGDSTLNWTYFVRDLDSGDSFEIGPDWARWTAWNLVGNVPMAINENGSATAWAVQYPSGDKPVVLAMQSGEGLATTTILDSFDNGTTVNLYGMSHSRVLVRVSNASGLDELRTYSGAGDFALVPESGISVMNATFSANGQAVGFQNSNSDTFRCEVNGVTNTFPVPRQLGMSYASQIRVANDCSWILTGWEIRPGFPRGEFGLQLIRIYANGRVTRLDSTTGTGVSWLSNLAGTVFIRATTLQLEPGDLNGVSDIYRGLGQAAEVDVHLKQTPQISWNLSRNVIAFGESVELEVTAPSTTAAKVFRVVYGQCEIIENRVFARSGIGGCRVEVSIAENDEWLAATSGTNLSFTKASRPPNEVTITAPTSVELGANIAFEFNNPENLPYNFNVVGNSCGWVNNRLQATRYGECVLVALRAENENYFEARIEKRIAVTKVSWTPQELNVGDIAPKFAGDVFSLNVQNNTGQAIQTVATGACSVDAQTVWVSGTSSSCTVSVIVAETDDRAMRMISKTFAVSIRKNVASAIVDSDWSNLKRLPKGSKLNMNAMATLISGNCSISGKTVTAKASAGACVVLIGGYTEGDANYLPKRVTIQMGPATQTWATALPTYTSKKLSTSKIVIPLNGYATTSLGLKGSWSATSGCKVAATAKAVTLDMGKLKKCVVTLRSGAGFRVPAISKSYTFTR